MTQQNEWKLHFHGMASTPDWQVSDGSGKLVCTLAETTTRNAASVTANAYLIAAAPTMAARLQGALDCLNQHKVFPADIEQAKNLIIDALKSARIAPKPLNRN
jgi:hypothetical protein